MRWPTQSLSLQYTVLLTKKKLRSKLHYYIIYHTIIQNAIKIFQEKEPQKIMIQNFRNEKKMDYALSIQAMSRRVSQLFDSRYQYSGASAVQKILEKQDLRIRFSSITLESALKIITFTRSSSIAKILYIISIMFTGSPLEDILYQCNSISYWTNYLCLM